ncbi:hypothetical protein B0H14DRAFT_3459371 [Mycena olivaceomarginata]|nr:hypothetical protein B0H14DRAFT_3459371 [Mycena olivaceomarginata]
MLCAPTTNPSYADLGLTPCRCAWTCNTLAAVFGRCRHCSSLPPSEFEVPPTAHAGLEHAARVLRKRCSSLPAVVTAYFPQSLARFPPVAPAPSRCMLVVAVSATSPQRCLRAPASPLRHHAHPTRIPLLHAPPSLHLLHAAYPASAEFRVLPTRPHRACTSLRVRFACGVAAHAGHPPRCTPLHCASPASRHSAASRISTASRRPPHPHVLRAAPSPPVPRPVPMCPSLPDDVPAAAAYPIPPDIPSLSDTFRCPPRLPLRRLSRLPSFALPSDVAYHALAVANVVPSLVPRASTLDGVLRFPYAPTRDFSTARPPHHTLHIYTHPTAPLPTVVPHSASPHPPLPCEWRP